MPPPAWRWRCACTPPQALAQTKLRVFSGGQQQRPDLMQQLFEAYSKANPGVSIEIETGGVDQ